MREAGELALHPHELLGILDGLLLGLGHVDAREVAAVLRTRFVAYRSRGLVIELPDLLGLRNRGVERDVGIALLGGPDDRLLADDARYPDARIRLLQGESPRVDDTMLVVRALPAE